MKYLYLLLVLLFPICSNATNVSGLISTNTTWTKANSPYIVTGHLAVDSNVVLTIEPGVLIKVDSNCQFYVDGKLIAIGTSTDTIVFTTNKTVKKMENWLGVEFRQRATKDTSIIKYCRFEYAKYGVNFRGPSLEISNCIFENNTVAIKSFNNSKSSSIADNKITNNKTGCDLIEGAYLLAGILKGNVITYNEYGIKASNSDWDIINNNFSFNTYGIWINHIIGNGYSTISGNIVANNTDYGIWMGNNSTYGQNPITHNLISHNKTGVRISGLAGDGIQHNTIVYNEIGVIVRGVWTLVDKINYNCIANNFTINLKVEGTENIDLKNNWWGTDTLSIIDLLIYDYYDDFTSGKGDYLPILTQPDTSCQPSSSPGYCFSPINPKLTNITKTTAFFSWDSVAGNAGYQISVVPYPAAPMDTGGVITAKSVYCVAMQPGTKYSFCVRTICANDTSAWVCTTATTKPACNPPSKINFTSVTDKQMVIYWDTLANDSGYQFYISEYPAPPNPTVTYIPTSSIYATNLSAGKKYIFCTRTICPADTSGWICDTISTEPNSVSRLFNNDQVITAYPNPATSNLALEFPDKFAGQVILLDMLGKVVYSSTINTSKHIINMSNLQNGIYFIKYTSSDYSSTIKILKE